MPELPEVETVRQGLAPAMLGARFHRVRMRRPDLRFSFPAQFEARLTGARVGTLLRRGKYLIANLSTEESLVMHLGMSGRFRVLDRGEGSVGADLESHTHVIFTMAQKGEETVVTYADPRRFGFMDLVPTDGLDQCRHFAGMGPEPLASEFTADVLQSRLRGRKSPLKTALLDQSVVAGLGNIYVCEALFRARLSPRRRAGTVGPKRAERLVEAIQAVLTDAVQAGGSSLRDYSAADGSMGMFQHRFDVYGRAGQPCPQCGTGLGHLQQSGRSTFFCANCQR